MTFGDEKVKQDEKGKRPWILEVGEPWFNLLENLAWIIAAITILGWLMK